MKKILITLLFVTLYIYGYSTHLMGGYIHVERLGNGLFRIYLTVIQDCNGSWSTGGSRSVSIDGCGFSQTITLNSVNGYDATPYCLSMQSQSPCNGSGASLGVWQEVYMAEIQLPACSNLIISYQQGNRNGSITNLSGPSSQEIYVSTEFNTTIANSSPQFSVPPMTYLCTGQPVVFNPGAFDPDGDHLVFSLGDCYQGAGMPVNYTPPFSGTNPMSDPVSINPQTGEIVFNQSVAQVAAVCVLVSEYRNGVLIGQSNWDVQVTTIPGCSNLSPILSGINGLQGNELTVCPGQPISFSVNGTDPDGQNLTYTANGLPGASISQIGNTATVNWTAPNNVGDYVFTVNANDNNCPIVGAVSGTYLIHVVNGQPPVIAAPATPICSGETIILNATSTGSVSSWAWINPGNQIVSNNSSYSFSPTSSGNYIVVGTYSDGCQRRDTVYVEVYQPISPSIIFNSNNVCVGSSFAMSSTLGTSYQWSNGETTQTTQSIAPLVPGQYPYSVTVSDNHGCISSSTEMLNVQGFTSFNTQVLGTTCIGNNVVIEANSTATSYIWVGPNGFVSSSQLATLNNITLSSEGTYYVTITDNLGCTGTGSVFLDVHELPTIGVYGIQPVRCYGQSNGSFNINVSGQPGFQYSYSYPLIGNTPMVSGLPSGTYAVTVTDGNGCVATEDNIIIIQPAPLSVSGTSTNATCYGSCDGQISVVANGGVGNYLYDWSSGLSNSDSVVGICPGYYSLSVFDGNGCHTEISFSIIQPNPITLWVVQKEDISCHGANNGHININALGGTGNYTYQWSNGATSEDIEDLSANFYNLTVSDANGCEATILNTIISEPNPLLLSHSLSNVTCNGLNNGSININPIGGTLNYNFIWSNAQSTEDIEYLTAGEYSVTVSDQNGCTISTDIEVTQPDPLKISKIVTQPICFYQSNGEIHYTLEGGSVPYTFEYVNQGAQIETDSTYLAQGLAEGVYVAVVTDDNMCQIMDTTILIANNIELIIQPTFYKDLDNKPIEISPIRVYSNSPVNYDWYHLDIPFSTDSSIWVNPMNNNTYTLVITDQTGCTASASVNVILDETPKVFIYNAFTPNGDGINDTFHPIGGDNVESFSDFYVYDRWGNLLFSCRNAYSPGSIELNWDGTFQNSPMNTGVYLGIYKVTLIDKRVLYYKVDINLIR